MICPCLFTGRILSNLLCGKAQIPQSPYLRPSWDCFEDLVSPGAADRRHPNEGDEECLELGASLICGVEPDQPHQLLISAAPRPLISYGSWHPEVLPNNSSGVPFPQMDAISNACAFVRKHALHISRTTCNLIFIPHLLGQSFFVACRETSFLVKVL